MCVCVYVCAHECVCVHACVHVVYLCTCRPEDSECSFSGAVHLFFWIRVSDKLWICRFDYADWSLSPGSFLTLFPNTGIAEQAQAWVLEDRAQPLIVERQVFYLHWAVTLAPWNPAFISETFLKFPWNNICLHKCLSAQLVTLYQASLASILQISFVSVKTSTPYCVAALTYFNCLQTVWTLPRRCMKAF